MRLKGFICYGWFYLLSLLRGLHQPLPIHSPILGYETKVVSAKFPHNIGLYFPVLQKQLFHYINVA